MLYRRAGDLEAPVGQGVPLLSPNRISAIHGKEEPLGGKDLFAPKELRSLTEENGDPNPVGPPPNPFVEVSRGGDSGAKLWRC